MCNQVIGIPINLKYKTNCTIKENAMYTQKIPDKKLRNSIYINILF